VEETIVEVSKKHSPTGQRYLAKPYPKDNEPRVFAVRQAWLDAIAEHIQTHGIGHDELLFATTAGTPISRNTFRTRIWLPAVKASGMDFPVRVHDLRHAHASWLLTRRVRPQVRDGPHGPRADHHHPEVFARPARRRPEEPRGIEPDPRQGAQGRRWRPVRRRRSSGLSASRVERGLATMAVY
jgi:integrase